MIAEHDPPLSTNMHKKPIITNQQEASMQHSHANHMELDNFSDHAGHVIIYTSTQPKQPTWVRLARGPYKEGKKQETKVKVTVGRKKAKVVGGVENEDETSGKEKRTKLDVGCPYPTSSTVEVARQLHRLQ